MEYCNVDTQVADTQGVTRTLAPCLAYQTSCSVVMVMV